ncbi:MULTISPECIES: Stf0 family sulfotransferase [Falsihalocynthiibacter]|uniref:Stf0 family sulfotransferase n=1 Tax=Falsihalocynthiibacter TaxID=2854182 RepID=UPI003002AA39
MTFNKILMVAQPRSGTNFFIRKFAQDRCLSVLNEPFNNGGPILGGSNLLLDEPRVISFLTGKDVSRECMIDKFRMLVTKDTFKPQAVGVLMKIFPEHNVGLLDDIPLKFPEMKYLIIERRNKLAQYISYKHAMKSKVWRVKADADQEVLGYQDIKIKISLDEFEKFSHTSVAFFERYKSLLNKLHRAYSVSYYEDFTASTEVIDDLARKFKVSASIKRPHDDTKKLNKPLSHYIENVSELERIFEMYGEGTEEIYSNCLSRLTPPERR